MPSIRPLLAILCLGWASLVCAADPARPSTAQPNVSVWPEALPMPGLNRTRQIRVYLPPGYAESTKRYPVLYMHDGQNLFDDATSYSGEWGVDETLNALAREGKLELIVVGIDNGGDKRMTELNGFDDSEAGKKEGEAYVRFIVETVKPLIDQRLRTRPERQYTGIMGSSMGGLISHYAIARYPQVFGKAGVFSPSYWIAPSAKAYLHSHPLPADARVDIVIGGFETGAVSDALAMYEFMLAEGRSSQVTRYHMNPIGVHHESFWRQELARSLLWLYAE
ncbi:alpha/beta hydrolase [Massilia sp. TS11]|uniref:alpha/beta hydrolase n=1 Tax=Massilia sp. TS11 TaxID=2908003 RepID=UPI001EDB65CE|nr:alpha/beta hydrolase-fold protein [Massilia sp. TS11]MCG2585577.1 alpha/beta hydrolase [Massilia sp. TS11]